jgi:hypothetical protein
MRWGYVLGALGLAVGAAILSALAQGEEERREERKVRRQKRWEEKRSAVVLAEKRAYDAQMRVYDEGQKEQALIEKYASARSYWQAAVGDGKYYNFTPVGTPADDVIAAEVLEVLDKGLRVEDENGVRHFISFEGTKMALEEVEESEEEGPPAPPVP